MIKTVIVTGASSGIGAQCARVLIKSGYNVAVCYNKNEKAASELCEEVNKVQCECKEKEHRQKAVPFFVDVRSEQSVQELVQNVTSTFGGVHALVNNAGTAQFNLLTHTTKVEWDELFAVHVSGAFLCAKHVLPQMIREKSGNIVNVSSMWGQVGASCEVAYSAAKAAIIGMTKALAKEVGPSGINVNCVAPGVIETPMIRRLSSEELYALTDETPLGRIGTPKDVANAVDFLLSSRADFLTGQVLGVNGGFVV